jgi:hypothetical protein
VPEKKLFGRKKISFLSAVLTPSIQCLASKNVMNGLDGGYWELGKKKNSHDRLPPPTLVVEEVPAPKTVEKKGEAEEKTLKRRKLEKEIEDLKDMNNHFDGAYWQLRRRVYEEQQLHNVEEIEEEEEIEESEEEEEEEEEEEVLLDDVFANEESQSRSQISPPKKKKKKKKKKTKRNLAEPNEAEKDELNDNWLDGRYWAVPAQRKRPRTVSKPPPASASFSSFSDDFDEVEEVEEIDQEMHQKSTNLFDVSDILKDEEAMAPIEHLQREEEALEAFEVDFKLNHTLLEQIDAKNYEFWSELIENESVSSELIWRLFIQVQIQRQIENYDWVTIRMLISHKKHGCDQLELLKRILFLARLWKHIDFPLLMEQKPHFVDWAIPEVFQTDYVVFSSVEFREETVQEVWMALFSLFLDTIVDKSFVELGLKSEPKHFTFNTVVSCLCLPKFGNDNQFLASNLLQHNTFYGFLILIRAFRFYKLDPSILFPRVVNILKNHTKIGKSIYDILLQLFDVTLNRLYELILLQLFSLKRYQDVDLITFLNDLISKRHFVVKNLIRFCVLNYLLECWKSLGNTVTIVDEKFLALSLTILEWAPVKEPESFFEEELFSKSKQKNVYLIDFVAKGLVGCSQQQGTSTKMRLLGVALTCKGGGVRFFNHISEILKIDVLKNNGPIEGKDLDLLLQEFVGQVEDPLAPALEVAREVYILVAQILSLHCVKIFAYILQDFDIRFTGCGFRKMVGLLKRQSLKPVDEKDKFLKYVCDLCRRMLREFGKNRQGFVEEMVLHFFDMAFRCTSVKEPNTDVQHLFAALPLGLKNQVMAEYFCSRPIFLSLKKYYSCQTMLIDLTSHLVKEKVPQMDFDPFRRLVSISFDCQTQGLVVRHYFVRKLFKLFNEEQQKVLRKECVDQCRFTDDKGDKFAAFDGNVKFKITVTNESQLEREISSMLSE